MLKSGLISLSIHDTLTFEGTEVAIHPELFLLNNEPGIMSSSSSRHSVLMRQERHLSEGSILTQMHRQEKYLNEGSRHASEGNLSDPNKDSTNTRYQQSTSLTEDSENTADESNTSTPRRLEVGDMIEIKVWDPKQKNLRTSPTGKTPRTSLLQSTAPSCADSASSASDPRDGKTSLKTKKTLEEAAKILKNPKAEQAPGSLAYSADHSPTKTPEISSSAQTPEISPVAGLARKKAQFLEDNLSTIYDDTRKKTIVSPSSPPQLSPKLSPPIVIRARTNTTETNPRPGKPPLVQRAKSSTSSMQIEPRRPALKAGHFRDLSDMTMDSLIGTNFSSDDDNKISPSISSNHIDGTIEEDNMLAKIRSKYKLRLSIVMLVTENSLTSLKGQTRSQISILRQVADLYGLSPYDMVSVNRIEKADEDSTLQAVSADFVEVTFKDQFISRGDMFFLQKSLIGRWIYQGARLTDNGIRAHAQILRHGDEFAKSGIITADTKITFRSQSTRIVWLVQMSSEMWDYANPYPSNNNAKEQSSCRLVFDKFISFMNKLFMKWQNLEVSHSLTVVFFSRTLVSTPKGRVKSSGKTQDVYGRFYEDHFKKVVDDEILTDWSSLVARMRQEFVRYPLDVGWKISEDTHRHPSTAMQGNLLEAINVCLNLLQFHFMDRDLHRSGNSIVVISPDGGVFEVNKTLAGITYQRMMDNGIGSDMVCLGRPPLHVAPFFLYNNIFRSADNESDMTEKTFSEVPHWMNLTFVDYDEDSELSQIQETSAQREKPDEGIRIGSNGFLRPAACSRSGHNTEQHTLNPFTPVSGMSRSQSQQRQLISGRDFKDILEACRPRTTSYILPSPLANLLLVYNRYHRNVPKVMPCSISRDALLQLTEWGAIDFDEMESRVKFIGLNIVPTASSNQSLEEKGESDRSSPSSSIGSQLSNLICRSPHRSTQTHAFLSANHDSFISTNDESGSPRGLEIQRSPSFELNLDSSRENKEGEFDPDSFRRAMSEHDKKMSTRQHVHSIIDKRGPDPSRQKSPGKDNEINSELLSTSQGSGNEMLREGLGEPSLRYKVNLPPTLKRIYSSGKLNNFGTSPSQRITQPFALSHSLDFQNDPPNNITPFVRRQQQGVNTLPEDQILPTFAQQQQEGATIRVEDNSPSKTEGILSCSFEKTRGVQMRFETQMRRGLSFKSEPGQPEFKYETLNAKRLSSPLKSPAVLSRRKGRSKDTRQSTKKRKKVVNPFRQQDEDEELEKISHNRRRWSHVFPLGELEFKRHTGPLWKSLCLPAILPLTIDYFPPPQELDDVKKYLFSPYQLTLQGLENTHYSSNSELLLEMVRQRITQDFQVVPPSALSASNTVREGDIQHFLSMGHRIHVLTYDSQSDEIDVKLYTARIGEDSPIIYNYYLYSASTKSYSRTVQTFEKYSRPYRWNLMDHIILEDIGESFKNGMRCRRLQYGLIPPKLCDDEAEQLYVEKFKNFLDYLGKLCESDEASSELGIEIITSTNKPISDPTKITRKLRRGTIEEMKSFFIKLRTRKKEIYEWVEVAIDSVFEVSKTYRIMFYWLIAGTGKVEALLQQMQRRCTQFGLEMTSFPQTCIARDLLINPVESS